MRILKAIQGSRLIAALLSASALALSIATTTPAKANIVTVDEMMRGITMTQAQCAVLPSAVWVRVDGSQFCIRYYLSNAGGTNLWPAVFMQGDYLGTLSGDNRWMPGPNVKDVNTDLMMKSATGLSKRTGTTAIYLARVGIEGSSGDHRIRHSVLELRAMHAALDAIKARHGFKGFHLIGQSGGSKIVGGLLALREDIGCAVIGAGWLSAKVPPPRRGLGVTVEYYNVADSIPVILTRRSTRIILVTDPADKKVPEPHQTDFVRKLRAAGGHVEQYLVEATDENRHGITPYAFAAGADCMRNTTPAQIETNLQELVKKRLAAKAKTPTEATPTPRVAHTEPVAPVRPGRIETPARVDTPAKVETPARIEAAPAPARADPPRKSLSTLFGSAVR
jgi:hypothetical protein